MRALRWFKHFGLTLAGLSILAGCVVYTDVLQGVEYSLARQDPKGALVQLESVATGSRNKLLYYMERGMLARMNGDFTESAASFDSAKVLMEQLEPISVSGSAGRIILSEVSGRYRADDFERLQVHAFQAVNYLELDRSDDARVEALQIDLLLRRVGRDGLAKHGGDAFARYLSGVIFEGRGELSDALIAYRKALEVYDNNKNYGVSIPMDLKRRLIYLADTLGAEEEAGQFRNRFGINDPGIDPSHGEIILILSSGLAPKRLEYSSLTQDPESGKLYRISLPKLQVRPSHGGGAVLSSGGKRAQGFAVDSIRSASQRTLQAELPGLIAKAIARNVIKNAVANQAGKESETLELAINIAGALFENADTRSWRTLPDTIYITRLSLPAGVHDVTINIRERNVGRLKQVEVKGGKQIVISHHRTGL
ncbi:MAG: hypothetical protein V3T39_04845 [Gammaproteobacteria bacterium]